MDKIIVGVDIGGSHITAALVNLETRSILPGSEVRGSVNSQGTVRAIINEWCSTIKESLFTHNRRASKMGIAMPGPFNYKIGISKMRDQNKYDALYNLNVKELLASALQISEEQIEFLNDAKCFLAGEVFCGAAKGCRTAIGLTLGTGLGTAWYRNEKVEDAALWDFPFNGGIAEDYLATRWFVKRYNELSGRKVNDVRELATITDADPDAKVVFDEFGENLSDFLGQVFYKGKPEMIVIGGNIAKAFNLFYPMLDKGLKQQGLDIKIQKAVLGEEAALIGAASSWDKKSSNPDNEQRIEKKL